MTKKIIAFLWIFFSFNQIVGQSLLPYIENFSKTNYGGDNQVWSLTQGEDHAMYFANNLYFLRYNGVKWERYTLPNKTIIRSVFAKGDKIYAGSYNEFGFWKRVNGEMKYTSLSEGKNLFTGISINEEIWKIFEYENKIYFQSFNELFVLKNNQIQKIRLPFQISYCFIVNDICYAATIKDGIYKYENGSFKKVNKWKQIENQVIHSIDSYQNDTYIFTHKKGVFVDKNGILEPWNHPINQKLKDELILSAKIINNEKIIIGTAFNGIYAINRTSQSYTHINRANGLKNNSILTLGTDLENDLWIGLDNGISYLEINSPYRVFSDQTGALGTVYSIAGTNKNYVLGSNHGVFTYSKDHLNFVPNSQGQVWEIFQQQEKYIIGHNDGTFIYENKQLKKANEVSGGWKMVRDKFQNQFYQGNYSGIVQYNQLENLQDYKVLPMLTRPIKNMIQTKPNELWVVDNYRGLYRIILQNNGAVVNIENITEKNKVENDFKVKLFNYNNIPLFLIDRVWQTYNYQTNRLEKYELFNTNFSGISEIIPINNTHFLVNKDKLLYIIRHLNNQFEWELLPEKYYTGKIINEDTKIHIDGDHLLLNLDEGFMVFNLNKKSHVKQKIKLEAFYQNNLIYPDSKIEHNQSIELHIISNFYGYNKLPIYYTINNSTEFISATDGLITLNNLTSGNQHIKFYYFDKNNYVFIDEYQFIVAQPWYFSILMISVYIAIISTIFYIYYRWNKIRYRAKLNLKDEELKHKQEILKLEMEAQNKIKEQEYEKHILEVQIQAKASEVAGKSLSVAKQSEMIDNILTVLDKENDISKLKTNIKRTIKTNAVNKKEWETFEKNLLQSNEDFIQKLTKKFPFLTSKDLKLCIYLKMNLSSKEIAPLLGISFRGVELHRYRLRKKLELTSEDNLTKFMMSL